jgi:penicillin-binding protein 1A
MRFLLKLFIYLVVFSSIFAFFAFIYYSSDLPDVEELSKDDSKQSIEIHFSNDEILTSYGKNNSSEVKFYQLPQNLVNAVIAIEDKNFFSHTGFDVKAIIRAFYVNQRAGSIKQGASTVTQQLAKLLFLSSERTFKRKIQEMILAFKLERKYSKEQIMAMYLNHAYFGSGNYGIAAAAKYYFGKDVSALSLRESTLLAGLLKAPSKLSPKNDAKSAQERADLVLSRMIDEGFVASKNSNLIDSDIAYKTNRLQRLYFADYIRDQFDEYLSREDLKSKRIIVKTTLNEKLQEKLEDELNKFVDKNSKRLGKSEIAVVIMDKNGGIIALTGGKNYQKSQFNRALYSKRQAGSVFKTFVYLTAFEKGFKPSDVFEDKKIEFSTWLPNNYDDKYFGKVTLKEAFAKSLNSVAIQLAKKVGTAEIARTAKKLGIVSKINENDLTMALGTSQVSLFELTSAFASILNDSTPLMPHGISQIFDEDGKILYLRESSGFFPILSEQTMNYGYEVLQEAVVSGTAKKAFVKSGVYGKTGTSQNYRDAWFVGFDDKFAIGVWIGNDDNSPTKKITGGSLPAQLFGNIISRL